MLSYMIGSARGEQMMRRKRKEGIRSAAVTVSKRSGSGKRSTVMTTAMTMAMTMTMTASASAYLHREVSSSHSLTVPSSPPDTMYCPSGDTEIARTGPL